MAKKRLTKAEKEEFEFQKGIFLRGKNCDLTIDEAVRILRINTKRKFNEIVFKRNWFWQMVYDNEKNEKANGKKLISLSKLGKITGGQTHASVLHGIKQARLNESWLTPYQDEIKQIVERIKEYKK